jgi:mono/diheme cytochrome c family protein
MSSWLARGAAVMLALLVIAASASSQQAPVKRVTYRAVASVNGRDLYKEYCLHCHGEDGKGTGPDAAVLRAPPADLTTIAARNGLKFSSAAVEDKINGWKLVPRNMKDMSDRATAMNTGKDAENVPVMPLFGPIFASLYSQEIRDRQVRMANLTRYVKSLQVAASPGEAEKK